MRKGLLIILFLVWSACSAPKRPDGVLTQAEFSAALIDIYMAEARLEELHIAKDTAARFFVPFQEKLFKAKGISDSIMRKTYAYYLAHPKELEQVYDAIIDTLVLRDQRLVHEPRGRSPIAK